MRSLRLPLDLQDELSMLPLLYGRSIDPCVVKRGLHTVRVAFVKMTYHSVYHGLDFPTIHFAAFPCQHGSIAEIR